MADRTSYVVEVYDPSYLNVWSTDDPENAWSVTDNKVHDTFADAEEVAKSYTGVYRSVRIRKHVYTDVALYQDGVPVE